MAKIFHIAVNTFRESARDRILYVIVFFAALMMAASQGLGWVSIGQEAQIVQHFSLAVVSFFGALIAVFVGAGLIFKEIDQRTIYTILAKPVARWQFVLGKFLGLEAVLFCVVFGMGLIAAGFVKSAGGTLPPIYFAALILIYCELTVVTALALLFGAVASPILAAIFTFCAYLIGQVTPDLLRLAKLDLPTEAVAAKTGEHLTDVVSSIHWLLKPLGQALYYALPDLTHFQLRNRVVYGPPLARGWHGDGALGWLLGHLTGEFGQAMGYAACYSLAVLVVTMLIFNRNRF